VAIFEFQRKNTHFALKGGRGFTNGSERVMEVPEGEYADLLRRAGRRNGVQELSEMPHETLRRYTEESNENAHYPMPDFENQRVVLVGRGVSSIGYRERYDAGYVICGINPASIPLSRTSEKRVEPTDGVHAGDYSFDCIFSLDQHYYSMEYPRQYKGAMLGPDIHGKHYFGPGTFHGITKILPHDASLSFGFALLAVTTMGASDVILCGCDFSGDYARLRARSLRSIQQAQEKSNVWIDKDNIWKPEGVGVWDARGN
jgi:hypothetical protein